MVSTWRRETRGTGCERRVAQTQALLLAVAVLEQEGLETLPAPAQPLSTALPTLFSQALGIFDHLLVKFLCGSMFPEGTAPWLLEQDPPRGHSVHAHGRNEERTGGQGVTS